MLGTLGSKWGRKKKKEITGQTLDLLASDFKSSWGETGVVYFGEIQPFD